MDRRPDQLQRLSITCYRLAEIAPLELPQDYPVESIWLVRL